MEEKAQSLVTEYNEMLEYQSSWRSLKKLEELKEKLLSEVNKLVERLAAEMAAVKTNKQQQLNERYVNTHVCKICMQVLLAWLDLKSFSLGQDAGEAENKVIAGDIISLYYY